MRPGDDRGAVEAELRHDERFKPVLLRVAQLQLNAIVQNVRWNRGMSFRVPAETYSAYAARLGDAGTKQIHYRGVRSRGRCPLATNEEHRIDGRFAAKPVQRATSLGLAREPSRRQVRNRPKT